MGQWTDARYLYQSGGSTCCMGCRVACEWDDGPAGTCPLEELLEHPRRDGPGMIGTILLGAGCMIAGGALAVLAGVAG